MNLLEKEQKKHSDGFTLLELIVAIFLAAFTLVALLGLSNYALMSASKSKNKLTASFLAQEGIEVVRYIREKQVDWDSWYVSLPSGNYIAQYDSGSLAAFPGDIPLKINNSGFYQYNSGANTPFYRKITITKSPGGNSNEIKVVSEVKWKSTTGWSYLVVEDRLWNWR
jgi:type II secretory pathway pseudopilin PulG